VNRDEIRNWRVPSYINLKKYMHSTRKIELVMKRTEKYCCYTIKLKNINERTELVVSFCIVVCFIILIKKIIMFRHLGFLSKLNSINYTEFHY